MLGVSVAVASLFRYESFLLAVPLVAAVPWFTGWNRLRRNPWRWVVPLAAPAAAALAWTLWYNDYRAGSPFSSSIVGGFTTPLVEGIQRQLLSPGKGFFWYNPILVAALPGLWLLRRRQPALTLVIVALFVGRVVFFARYYNPDGSIAWGPRYLVHTLPLLAIGLGELIEQAPRFAPRVRALVRTGVAGLVIAGVAVTLSSLWVPYSYIWSFVNDIPGWQQMPVEELNALKDERYSRQMNDPRLSPIVLNLRHLDDAARYKPGFPLRWWEGGPSAVGAVTAVAALGATVAAVRVASRRDDEEGEADGPASVTATVAAVDVSAPDVAIRS